jgi:glycosyltransferase involved in cell wall biosynthesis
MRNISRKDISISICIPTFNRKKKLIKLLRKIKKFSKKIENQVEVVVSDNSTQKKNYLKKKEIKNFNKNFRYNINKKNIGLAKNFEKLLRLAKNDYIWVFADDDLIKPNSINSIIDYLKLKNMPNLLMINYNNIDLISKKKSNSDHMTIEKKEYYENGSEFVRDYLYECGGIQTQIFKQKLKKEYFKVSKKINFPTYQHLIFYYNIAMKYGKIAVLKREMFTMLVNAKKMSQEVGAYNQIEFIKVISYLKQKDKKNITYLENKVINLLWLTTFIFASLKIFVIENRYNFSTKFYSKLYDIKYLSLRSKILIVCNHITYLFLEKSKFFVNIFYNMLFSKKNWKKNIIKKFDEGKAKE